MKQQKKSCAVISYFSSIGIVIAIMETAANKVNGGITSTRIKKLNSLDLSSVSTVRDNFIALRHRLVHSPLDINEVSAVITQIDRNELVIFLSNLSAYINIDIEVSVLRKIVNDIYTFIFEE